MHGWQVYQRTHFCYASEQGLCPKLKYPRFHGGIIIEFVFLQAIDSEAVKCYNSGKKGTPPKEGGAQWSATKKLSPEYYVRGKLC